MTLEELQARKTKLETIRFSGVQAASTDGDSVTYRTPAELQRAIQAVDDQIAALTGSATVKRVYIQADKGV